MTLITALAAAAASLVLPQTPFLPGSARRGALPIGGLTQLNGIRLKQAVQYLISLWLQEVQQNPYMFERCCLNVLAE